MITDRLIPLSEETWLIRFAEAVTTYPEDQFGEVTCGFVRMRVQVLYRATIDTTKWVRN